MSFTDKEANVLQKVEFTVFILIFWIETYFHSECRGQIKTGTMRQRGQFYSSEEAVAEIMRKLKENVDFNTEAEWNENEINVSSKTNFIGVTYGIIPERLINNITQRDLQSSDVSESDYCITEYNDEEATILIM